MLSLIMKSMFGSVNDRFVGKLQGDIQKINALEQTYSAFSDNELKAQTLIFKEKIASGASLNDILHDSFACIREAAKRVLNMRHFDVQLIGGMVLNQGKIAEMKTGEGKTLVATLPAYLNALSGKGVHIVTVNDYLAKRDSEWMGKIYEFLGLSVGCIVNGVSDEDRKKAYDADITYGTNNEFGFDYLRDNMKYIKEHLVQRPFNFAIIDEVDSILIDEARTPLIISGPTDDTSELYYIMDKIIKKLMQSDYEIDEKAKSVILTEEGQDNLEKILLAQNLIQEGESIYDIQHVALLHHANQALRAHKLFTLDVDYLIKDNKIVIVDEFTGRMMEGRRFSEGLHQALEAKEAVPVQNENQTLASITFQNYFRLYPKYSGMTGTAMTEAGEFKDIYDLDVIEIPTNIKISRIDEDDAIYRTQNEKYLAIVEEIRQAHAKKQPVLVGTVSIEKSEYIAKLLKKNNIPHNVLNAKFHEQEALIIAQAGRSGAVTISTNMAGRGTDIQLGGNPEMLAKQKLQGEGDNGVIERTLAQFRLETEKDKQIVIEAGGLLVLGTERHESRRIDNQLRGRSGRQGDPGRTQFFLSLEDDLMRIFGTDKISGLLGKLGLKENEAIYHPWISKALEKAQQKVESRNYEIRKNLLKYDDVMNEQRKVIYQNRMELIENTDAHLDDIQELMHDINNDLIDIHVPDRSYYEQWDVEGLSLRLKHIYAITHNLQDEAAKEGVDKAALLSLINKISFETYQNQMAKFAENNNEILNTVIQRIKLFTLDHLWKEHLHVLDHLKQSIHLRAYGQKDPLSEYKREAFELFQGMLENFRYLVLERFMHLEKAPIQSEQEWAAKSEKKKMVESRHEALNENQSNTPAISDKIGRNEPCTCGSGKKYKHCHGKF